jgi:two-component system phosphate regulon sensor histidine kinase PhoR
MSLRIRTGYKKSKNLNSVLIAIIIAAGIGVIMIVVFCIFFLLLHTSLILSLIITFSVCFLFGFLFAYYWIDLFIYQKIRLIYKVILDFKMSKSTKKDWNKKYKSIEMAERDALSFMEKKDNEMEQLRKMEMYRKDFLGNVSHELKTPLTAIQGYVLTLLDGGLSDEKINYKYLYQASKNIDRIIAIVDDLDTISNWSIKKLH